jgi:hypothetical protein
MVKTALFIFFMLVPFGILFAAPVIKDLSAGAITPLSETLFLRIIFALLAVFDSVFPWILERRQPFASPYSANTTQGSPQIVSMLFGFVFTVSPCIYGLIFYLLGGSTIDLYFFIGLALIATFIWGLHHINAEASA